MITLNNINLSSIDLSGIDLRGIKLGLGGRGGGSGDGFPQLPGDVTRWHFGGLTNEMMAAMDDPRIEDADHKGRFLSFKNFAWSGMSGVGGYVQDFNYFRNNATVDKVRIDEQNSNSIKVTILTTGINNAIYIPKNIYQFNKSYFIKISSEGYNEGDLSLSFYAPSTSTATTVKVPLNPNGITEIPAIKEDDFFAVYLDVGGKVGSITIEQLPLYPGFILGDGVDDFAVTEKELNFEDTYTVYTAFIPFQNNPTRNMILCGADSKKTFSMQYSSLVYVSFIAGNNYYINADFVNGLNLFACKRNGNNICIKNLLTNKVVTGTCGDWVENAGLYYLWKNATYASFARAAIAGQTICNGYFSTDEDDEKVLDWYKKQYPWLFPDQAWTVTGKTNEDKDRATIANITGNGNDLVLSNFAFSGNSGYGLYNIQKFTNWSHAADRGDIVKNGYSVTITNSKITGSSTNYNTDILYSYNSSSTTIIFKVTGLVDGQKIFLGRKSVTDAYVIDKDGIYRSDYNIPQKDGKVIVGIGTVGFTGECNITIEQIPEYEGYLVTDGVDDEVRSAAFTLNEDWTIVGNWEFITNENKNAGLTKVYSLYLYNRDYGIFVYKYINAGQGFSVEDVKSLKAICSDGRIYLNDWQEIRNNIEQEATISKGVMAIGYFNRDFTKMAFKNLGIYNNQLLSKDDCIKAYNYLQTLKAK
ncbi:hypothetical protein [Parabacteroides merdae]|uniref:hypothetical protein n=1 Tax=Parabacteroides merdae TaxID=46503 RepID=UPI003569714B